jgi:hypothetical protein
MAVLISQNCLRMQVRLLSAAFWLLTAGIMTNWSSTAAESLEYEVKAAFLYNFSKFVEWPVAENQEGGSFPLCVLGTDPFGPVLDATTNGKKVRGVPLIVRRIGSTTQASGCRILFICTSERKRFAKILEEIGVAEILTVSESHGFAAQGGIINFFLDDNDKVRFEINAENARRTGLQINAQLLELARVIGKK